MMGRIKDYVKENKKMIAETTCIIVPPYLAVFLFAYYFKEILEAVGIISVSIVVITITQLMIYVIGLSLIFVFYAVRQRRKGYRVW